TQTVERPSMFLGLAFSPDGSTLYASGGNDDVVYFYPWRDGQLIDEQAFSQDGKQLYVAENVGDTIAVVDVATRQVVQRLATEHYPCAIAVGNDGELWVSAWGGESLSTFHSHDGRLVADGRLRVGRHPSALLLHGNE